MKRLKRSSKDNLIGGVCGGLAEYTGTDPSIWRIFVALGAIMSCSVLFWGYILAWIIIPLDE
jgi:phage shock protein PspC (stress-responsive transcriptional regulator)